MKTPVILGTEGPLKGQSFPVDRQGVRIGRDPTNEVVIPTPDVSRHHARVILHNGALWVQDAGSRNGVYVNGVRVADHKQVSPGDRVKLGNSEFEIGLTADDTESSVSVNMDSVLPASQRQTAKKAAKAKKSKAAKVSGEKKWKVWPFAAAGGVMLLLLGVVVSAGGESTPEATASGVTPPSKFSLGGLANEQEAAKTKASGVTQADDGPQGFSASLMGAGGSDMEQRENWPKPPAGTTFADLRFKADTNYQQGRLRDSLTSYQMALQLKEDCDVCIGRIETLERRIREEVTQGYRDGLRYLDSHQYQQAIYAFERTLLLDPEKTLEDTLRSVEQIAVTKEKLPRQY
jgi:pSer/pThr/pTyr-binding forkhead associated (FHA) protein